MSAKEEKKYKGRAQVVLEIIGSFWPGESGAEGEGLLMGRGWIQPDSLRLAGEGIGLSRFKWEEAAL